MNIEAEEQTPQELRNLKRNMVKPTLHLKTYMQATLYVLGRLYSRITISGAEKKQ